MKITISRSSRTKTERKRSCTVKYTRMLSSAVNVDKNLNVESSQFEADNFKYAGPVCTPVLQTGGQCFKLS